MLGYLALLMALAVAPHFNNLSPWITGFFYLITAIRLLVRPLSSKPPSRWIMVPLTLFGVIVVLMVVGYSEGRQFGVALLIMMSGLKLLEMRNRRDLYITVTLGYFLLITLFLFDKSMMLSVYVLLLSTGFTALLVAANRVSDVDSPLPALRIAGGLVLGAIPIMILLFVFFPRMEGPLWRINLGESSSTSGISDHINMGSVGMLSLSEEVAFRVKFVDDAMPEPAQRYWRGMALSWTDGDNWERGYQRPGRPGFITPLDEPVHYTVIMEPSGQNWLFPLDRIAATPANTRLSPMMELTTPNPIQKRLTFEALSSLDFWEPDVPAEELAAALQLPRNITDRMQQLVNGWKLDHDDSENIISAALNHFNQQPFVYTLQPPVLQKNPLDEFLFETRKGFCEHYATSFVVLMRLAGIPARVVVGYQGGEWNPHGGHLIIRQSDAHAWSEVWLQNSGWTRIDPTAAIAPERIERSIDPSLLGEGLPVLFRTDELGFLGDLIRDIGWLKDSVQLNWHYWIIGFNQSRQSALLNNLGLGFLDQSKKGIVSIVGALGVAGLLFVYIMWKGRVATEPVKAAYSKFQNKLRKAGLEIPPWLGPEDLAQQAVAKFPQHGGEIKAIIQLYVSLRYGRSDSRAVQQNLLRRVRQFRIG